MSRCTGEDIYQVEYWETLIGIGLNKSSPWRQQWDVKPTKVRENKICSGCYFAFLKGQVCRTEGQEWKYSYVLTIIVLSRCRWILHTGLFNILLPKCKDLLSLGVLDCWLDKKHEREDVALGNQEICDEHFYTIFWHLIDRPGITLPSRRKDASFSSTLPSFSLHGDKHWCIWLHLCLFSWQPGLPACRAFLWPTPPLCARACCACVLLAAAWGSVLTQ